MYIDVENEFSDAQALSGAGAAASTNYIDLGSAVQIGVGKPLWVILQIDVALAGASGTLDTDVETDDNTAFSSATIIASTTQLTTGAAPAGTRQIVAIPLSGVERYLRLNYTLGGTTPSATVSAWLTGEEVESFVAYPDAVN